MPTQEVLLDTFLPVSSAPAPQPTYTAYEPVSRQYFALAGTKAGLVLWGSTLSGDVNTSTPMSPFGVVVSLAAGNTDTVVVGLEALNTGGTVTVLAVFEGGTVLTVDPATGSTAVAAALLNTDSRQVTQAITVDHSNVRLAAPVLSWPPLHVVAPQTHNENDRSSPV